MNVGGWGFLGGLPVFGLGLAVTAVLSGVVGATVALADDDGVEFRPGNLLLSRSVYDNNPANVVAGASLPPNCAAANCVTATADGSYPYVWNNSLVDGSFGITAKIVLDQLKPSGELLNSLEVPNSSAGVPPPNNQIVTSFPSKSQIPLTLSTHRH